MASKSPNVFISHSWDDKGFVRRLEGDLAAAGAIVWVDEAALKIGDSLRERIIQSIRTMDYVIIVLSSSANRSEWVKREINAAREHKIKLLPIRLHDCELPDDLKDTVMADFTVPEKYTSSLNRIFSTLELVADDTTQRRRNIESAASKWDLQGRDDRYRWSDELVMHQVGPVIISDPRLLSDVARDFLGPVTRRDLMTLLDNDQTSQGSRIGAGIRLSILCDLRPGQGLREDGLPDIKWQTIPEGQVSIICDDGSINSRKVAAFRLSRYPITWAQFNCFLDDGGDKKGSPWWDGIVHQPFCRPKGEYSKWPNHPAVNVRWYDAVAYCRWISAQYQIEVRLPSEWEWQQAATGGKHEINYPWGDWDAFKANTYENGLMRTNAVGIYPSGASPCGVLDMAGNCYEWCDNCYHPPHDCSIQSKERRVLRGGAFVEIKERAQCKFRMHNDPTSRYNCNGFRVACSDVD